ncbi:metallophosphoesterase family protein [Flavilitoribacter nigricans]|uniref:Serine/threonine protein phosphatase n=1 Tax=Flavilitoribacter nigricans (strain ATCC 23147 / DSM 23189 / NBRC 102662 / NCIMB 1420 / SS-2) TaxID=1122177 RepID=A0A2D0N5J3_FLAN2|nr:metallophosphoesterase family protein [Flavilitoribacter nigricans]PHN03781.1 serine/threonine protein phosphatase [Flavilitoribacter nigricans DSM 23189 = NBRC 102662]
MATFAIGDIHGCLAALRTIFDQSFIGRDDLVVFLGDYVDRGPDSKGVIDWLIEQRREYRFEFILGNHEIMMARSRNSRQHLMSWMYFGGTATLDSYGIGDAPDWADHIDRSHWDFIASCKPYLEYDQFLFVHAGLEPGRSLEAQDDHHLFWKKFEIPEPYSPEQKVICGHTSRKNGKIADFGHTICIDTYAYGGQWLTCLNVETNEYLQANSKGQIRRGLL